jgi:hypothetical protein
MPETTQDICSADDCLIIQADFAVTLRRAADMGGADLILMSPPYADARTYGADISWTMDDYQRLGDAVKPALKAGAHCLMVIDAPVRKWREGYGTERGFLPWQVMLDWAMRVGLRVPDRLAYARLGIPGAYAGRFRNDWEPLLWFQNGCDGYFDKWSIASEAAESMHRPRASARKSDGALAARKPSGRAVEANIRHRGTVWEYTAGAGHDKHGEITDHPARLCSRFAEDAVQCFCPPGGLVVDPFSGSGTSAAAAGKHGRRFFGGDLLARESDGKPWAQIGYERWQGSVASRTAQMGLF